MKRFAGTVIFSFALLSSLPAQAQDREHRDNEKTQRYYDRQTKDWHNWDEHEAQNYRRYQEEKHLQNRDFSRLKKSQQDDYFRWSHQHSDDHRDDRH
jgi:hypothetical protein